MTNVFIHLSFKMIDQNNGSRSYYNITGRRFFVAKQITMDRLLKLHLNIKGAMETSEE